MNTPAGISNGENRVLPIKSATMTRIPPISAETGNNAPNEEPTSLLAICGAIKPTKPIPPAKATEPPISAVLIINKENVGVEHDFLLQSRSHHPALEHSFFVP